MFWRLLSLTLFCHHIYAINQVCVEELDPQTLQCDLPASWQKVTWQLGGGVQVAQCTPGGNCTNSDGYQISSTATTSQLTISSVQRGLSNRLVTCVVDTRIIVTWNLTVYATPSSMMCSPYALTNGNTQINFTCSVQGIYPMNPQPVCFVNHQQTGNDLDGNVYITVVDDIITCTYIQKLNNLIPRDEQLIITIAPAVCEAEKYDQNKAFAIGITNTSAVVSLRLPTVKPINCPIVEVKAGEKVNCTCSLDDPGYPPGQPRWYSNNKGVSSTGNNGAQVLTIQMTSQNPNPVYVCDVDTILQNNIPSSSSNTFTPKTIFGPESLNMALAPSDSYDVCPGSAGITVNCTVPYNKINEFPNFTIMQDTDTISKSHGQLSGVQFYSHQKTVYPKSYGLQTFSCLAENQIYPEIFQRKDQSIYIRAPPSTFPSIQTNKHPARYGTFDAEVSVGDVLDVTCTVDGGEPAVTNIYMACKTFSHSAIGNTVSLRVEVTEETYGYACVCGATHVTSCYDLTTKMTFIKTVNNNLWLIIGLSCGGCVVLIVVIVVAVACYRCKSHQASQSIIKPGDYNEPQFGNSSGENAYVNPEVYDEPTDYSAPDETPIALDPDYLPTVDHPYPQNQNYPYSLSQNYPYPQNYSDGSFDPKNYDKFNGSITDFYRPFNPSDYSQSNYSQSNYNQSMTSGRQASNGSVPYTVAWGHRPLPPNKPEADYLQML